LATPPPPFLTGERLPDFLGDGLRDFLGEGDLLGEREEGLGERVCDVERLGDRDPAGLGDCDPDFLLDLERLRGDLERLGDLLRRERLPEREREDLETPSNSL